jgi:peptidoglycan hydrolase-like protein with peptidoglycan-binding domain
MALTAPRFASLAQLAAASENRPALARGAHGDGVRALQLALIELGLDMPVSTAGGTALPDGVFGRETHGVVQAFQRAHGLVADGVVGRLSLGVLESLINARSEARAREDALRSRQGAGLRAE